MLPKVTISRMIAELILCLKGNHSFRVLSVLINISQIRAALKSQSHPKAAFCCNLAGGVLNCCHSKLYVRRRRK